MWNLAISTQDDTYYIVEVPLAMQDFAFTINDPASSCSANTTTKLLVLQNKQNNSKLSVLMHINSQGTDKADFSYRKPPVNFNGYVTYTDLHGTFLLGWQFEEGKVIRKSTKTLERVCQTCNMADYGTSTQCMVVSYDVEERECRYYYNTGNTYCTEWEYVGTVFTTYCSNNGSGGGGGGGYTQQTDCAGVVGGSAYIGDCGVCVGGTTGLLFVRRSVC